MEYVKEIPIGFTKTIAYHVCNECLSSKKVIINHPIQEIAASEAGRLIRIEFLDNSFIAFSGGDLGIGDYVDVIALTKFNLTKEEAFNIYQLVFEMKTKDYGVIS